MVREGAGRRGNEQDQRGGTISGTEIQGMTELGDAHGYGNPVYEFTPRMRQSNATGKPGSQLVFPGMDLLQEALKVGNPTSRVKPFR